MPGADLLVVEVGASHVWRWTSALTVSTTPGRLGRERSGCRRSVHNLLLLAPPGVGKSMLARRLTTILQAMTLAEAIETTCIHRVAGLTSDCAALTVAHLGPVPPITPLPLEA
jgi:hypothetical protein